MQILNMDCLQFVWFIFKHRRMNHNNHAGPKHLLNDYFARETLHDILLHVTKAADEVNMCLGQLEICSVWICLINTHGNQ